MITQQASISIDTRVDTYKYGGRERSGLAVLPINCDERSSARSFILHKKKTSSSNEAETKVQRHQAPAACFMKPNPRLAF